MVNGPSGSGSGVSVSVSTPEPEMTKMRSGVDAEALHRGAVVGILHQHRRTRMAQHVPQQRRAKSAAPAAPSAVTEVKVKPSPASALSRMQRGHPPPATRRWSAAARRCARDRGRSRGRRGARREHWTETPDGLTLPRRQTTGCSAKPCASIAAPPSSTCVIDMHVVAGPLRRARHRQPMRKKIPVLGHHIGQHRSCPRRIFVRSH